MRTMECCVNRRYKIFGLVLLQYYFVVIFLTLLHLSLSDPPDFQNWNGNSIRLRAQFVFCIIHGFCAASLVIYLVLRKRHEVSECFRKCISSIYSSVAIPMRSDNQNDNDLSERVSSGFTYIDAKDLSPGLSNVIVARNPIESITETKQSSVQEKTKHKRNQSRHFLSGELGLTCQRSTLTTSFKSDVTGIGLPQKADDANCEEENTEQDVNENNAIPQIENVEITVSNSSNAASASKLIKESLESLESFVDPETCLSPSDNKYNFTSWILLDDLSTKANENSKGNVIVSDKYNQVSAGRTAIFLKEYIERSKTTDE